MNLTHGTIAALRFAAITGTLTAGLIFAPTSLAQPGAYCGSPAGAGDGQACAPGPAFNAEPGLTPSIPKANGPVTAGCIPGRACGSTDDN